MNSKKRVQTAINRQQPDRTPVDFWAESDVTVALLRHLGLASEHQLFDYLNVDIRPIAAEEPPFTFTTDGIRQNYWGELWQQAHHATGKEWLHLPGALSQAETLQDLKAFNWPDPSLIDRSTLPQQVNAANEYAIRYGNGDIFTRPCCVRGMEPFLIDIAVRPDMAHYIMTKFTDFYCEDLKRTLSITGGGIDIFLVYSDLGSQAGPLISRTMFDEFFAPYAKRLFGVARDAGIRTMLHSCGSIREFIPSLIDIGIEILNPIQVQAVGMEPCELKNRFGKQLCFHGAVDEQGVLPNGTPNDVRREVRTRVNQLGTDGGYIICATHNIQIDTPLQNILAMYDIHVR
jgi:uroporphyrinogen decarboxylase